MNEHAGPACALSGLIVGLSAFLLHEKPSTPPRPPSAARSTQGSPKGDALPEVRNRDATLAKPPIPTPSPAIARAPVAPLIEALPAPKIAGPTSRPRPKRSPESRGSVTTVGPGESLEDVAERVYGSRDSAMILWRANRDQLERVDSPLGAGSMLRTP